MAAVDITESRLSGGGDVGGGDRGFDDAEVATAKATAAVDVLLLDQRHSIMINYFAKLCNYTSILHHI